MADNGGMYVPTNLQWRIRSLANMSKTKIQITPTTPSTIQSGETVNGASDGTNICSWRFPRNTFSLIQEIQIKFNNVVVQHITDYNMIQNILFDIVSANQDAAGRMACSGLNNDPSMKKMLSADGSESWLYTKYSTIPAADATVSSDIVKDKGTYFIKNFLGILQQGPAVLGQSEPA
eukprot:317598-Hanusia_phi.AAC.1